MQSVTAPLKRARIDLHLLGRCLLVQPEPVLARQADSHGCQTLVVAGKTSRFRYEVGVGTLQQRQATRHRGLNRVAAPHGCRLYLDRRLAARGPRFQEKVN